MGSLLVSSKGQIVLPAATRRRLGLGAGTRLELIEEHDSLRLRVVRAVPKTDVAHLAGMVRLPSSGRARDLGDFDAARLLSRKRPATR